ncbi:hypothetical protein BC834DRAFT_429828 [Gloeopeniophorella convolvens]|nr:hypothetical protein BC834DRAFT_429828 [Gloeopeniophorella convolvens]
MSLDVADAERPLPTFDELPRFNEFAGCAWEVWGAGDQLGTVNLLTKAVVQRAAKEEIRCVAPRPLLTAPSTLWRRTGKTVSLNWPIHFLEKPMFNRRSPHVESFFKVFDVRDEEIHINSQSGSQWDGLKHFPLVDYKVLYQGIPTRSLPIGPSVFPDPLNVDPELIKLGIHNWAQHGICGRGVLLDLVRYFTSDGAELPYDPWTSHSVRLPDLEAVALAQGVEFRRGDILLLRVGFIQKYYKSSTEAREQLSQVPAAHTCAGIEQSENMKRFLWDNHFAAIASDQPALERMPPEEGQSHMHQTLLGLWGMPIGEFFDLEALSEVCASTGRYTFFFTSWPLNILGGVASPPNAAVGSSTLTANDTQGLNSLCTRRTFDVLSWYEVQTIRP